MNVATSMLKHWLRRLLYLTGMLGLVHRVRNRRTLTVLMYHRVLPASSTAFELAEREFTFSVDGFARSLDFLQRHYNIISLADLRAAIGQGRPLPDRAALITFDDGWRDTLVYALPVLRRRNIPGLLFLATEAIELASTRWWQDILVEILASPQKTAALLAKLDLEGSTLAGPSAARRITAVLGELPEQKRQVLLGQLGSAEIQERQMLSQDDLASLKSLICVGGHGHTHVPLSESRSLVGELESCRNCLIENHLVADVMSFPHGAYDDEVVRQARASGFDFLFSSDPVLMDSREIQPEKQLLGRIHIPENQWTCDEAGISFPKLASFLFFRRHA